MINSAQNDSHQLEHLPKICPLIECKHLFKEEVGEMVSQLGELDTHGLPIPSAWVVPVSYLHKLAEFNQFFGVLERTFKVTDLSNPLSQLQAAQTLSSAVQSFKFPESLQKILTKAYAHWMEGKFMAVRPSLTCTGAGHLHLSDLNIQGEANLQESLLRVWSKLYRAEYLMQRYQEWQTGNLIPAAFVIQEMIQGEAAGIGRFHQASGHSKSKVIVYSSWGVSTNWENLQDQGDMFEVDPHSWEITHREIRPKLLQWVRKVDRLEHEPVAKKYQNIPSLTDDGVITIAQRVYQVNKQRFSPVVVDWAAETEKMYVLDVRDEGQKEHSVLGFPMSFNVSHTPQAFALQLGDAPVAKHKIPLFVAIANPEKEVPNSRDAVGVGVLKSEGIYAKLPAHPGVLLKQEKKEVIRKALSHAVIKSAEVRKGAPVLLRSQNFTTQELAALPRGKEIEVAEPNPYLGYRGALRIIRDYQLFDIELDALMEAHHELQGKHQLGIIVPFIRDSSELSVLLHHFQKPQFASDTMLEFWMQCSTPENIFNIAKYCQKGVTGFSINLKTIHSLLHGIDPDNPDTYQLYPLNIPVMKEMLVQMQKTVASQAQHYKIHVLIEPYNPELLEVAAELKFDGAVVVTHDLPKAKTVVLSLDEE